MATVIKRHGRPGWYVKFTDATGRPVGVDQVGTTRGGSTLTGHLTGVLPAGVYTVRWRATGTDGDLVERNGYDLTVKEAQH